MGLIGTIFHPFSAAQKRRSAAISRATIRYSCNLPGTLIFMERMTSVEGVLIDFSRGGAMFRPRLAYLMERRNEPIRIIAGGQELYGLIVSTKPAGFGIRFNEMLTDETVEALVAATGQGAAEVPIYG